MAKKKASVEALEALHAKVAEALADRLETEEWTAADIGAAIRFLKDNSITAVAAPGSKLATLLDEIQNPEVVSDADYERIKAECAGNG